MALIIKNNQFAISILWEQLNSMELSCNTISTAPRFIKMIEKMAQLRQVNGREFFSGTCYYCAVMASEEVCLQQCSGCQLVSYCSKNCQRGDWKMHKIVCKILPVKEDKNIIERQLGYVGKDKDIIRELQYSVINDGESMGDLCIGAVNIFSNPRVCNVCKDPRPKVLFNCRCCSVSYCSETHRIIDISHRSQECDQLYECAVANLYLTQNKQLIIPDGLLNEANLNEGLKYNKVSLLDKYSGNKGLKIMVNLINERLAFPMTIYYALKDLKLGEQKKDLSEMTSLSIHMVHNTIMLDPRIWECFLHQLPNLNYLNLTFINDSLYVYNSFNTYLPLERCSECKIKQRVISYNVQPMHYHEYFATDDYDEPDVVAIFGVDHQLVVDRIINDPKADANCFTSQRNTTYSNHSVVILTHRYKHKLEECVRSFHEARPVKVLLPVQENPVRGFSTIRSMNEIHNDKFYLCCIQGDT